MPIAAGTITGVAYLVAELLSAGISIQQILTEAKATGIVPPERWDKIMDDQDRIVAEYKARRG